ncbi:roadblock/LC7 domain-containing protein [Caldivirga sp. UBA161]|uniref:roadblock/LC7 domain-containing protein n=1 Tax=Caldivirga sp. UBA161 TaxID=1915569 RepID=UPI0025C26EC6|nr:roadblock/LC7 domain-containing protein [Caldivirga sp. UBA161]
MRQEKGLVNELNDLLESYLRDMEGDVVGAVVSDVNGLPIVYKTIINLSVDSLSALCALAINHMRKISGEVKLGDIEYAVISYSGYVLYIEHIYGDLLLIVVANKDVNMGLITYVTSRYAEHMSNLIKATKDS